MDWQINISNNLSHIKFEIIVPAMFTFSAEHTLPRRGLHKLNPIPDIKQPIPLQSLPPLPFYIEAADPLPHLTGVEKQNQQFEKLAEKYKQERNQIDQKYRKLNDDYAQLKRQYDSLRSRYQEGEQIFIQMEADCNRMYHELEALRSKKEEKSRISIGLKKKQIPVVKISVPNPKALSQQSEKQSMYRQLKSASEQLAHMRKLLESEKQKSEHLQTVLNKNIEQLSNERQLQRNQILSLREENKSLKEEALKLKNISSNQNVTSVRSKTAETSQFQKLKSEFDRLEKVHKSCDILLQSKQTEIFSLKSELDRLARHNDSPSSYFHPTESRSKLKANSSFVLDKQSNQKEHYQTYTVFPESTAKKNIDFNHLSNPDYQSILQQHLALSAQEMESIEKFMKETVKDFISKIDSLKNQLEWVNKKAEHQKFELERVYQLLRDKKIELDHCYNDLKNVNKANKTPTKKEADRQDEFMKSILKGRRNLSTV